MIDIKNINKETLQHGKLTGKLVLTMLLLFLLLPFLSVSYLLNTKLNSETQFITQQKTGFAYINAVRTLLEHVQQYRGMAYASHYGMNEFELVLSELVVRIDDDLRVVEKMYASFSYLLQNKDKWIVWRRDWLKLQQEHIQISGVDHFAAHSELIDELLTSIREIVDVFRLTLDTQQDSRNLAQAIMQMPWQMEYMAQIRGLGAGIVARGSISANERVRLRALGQSISEGLDDLIRNMNLLFKRNPLLQSRLSPVLDKSVSSINHFLGMVFKQISGSAVLKDISTSAYFNAGTMVLDDFSRLFAAIESELEGQLTQRLKNTQHKQTLLQVSTLLVLAVTAAIYFIFLRHQVILTESKQKIQAIVENAADSIITINEQGIIKSFNSAAEKIFGYSADEIIEKNISYLIPEVKKHENDSDLHHYIESEPGVVGIGAHEVEAKRSDSSIFPAELSISEILHADGKRLIVIILHDLSKRKQAESELRASEERFNLVTRGTKDGIWDWDLTTGQIYFSSRWKSMLGYTGDEVEDNFKALQSLIHPDDLGDALDNWTSCMEGETNAFAIEYRLCTKQGRYRWIECRGLAQLSIEGEPIRIAGSHTDITERKQAYTELQQMTEVLATQAAELDLSNKELEQFAYIASHDLKAPLRAIANLSQWIEEDLDEVMTDDTRKQMALLRGRVQRMEGLINGVLQYSRVGRIDMEIEEVDVAELLDEILDGLAPPAGFNIDIAPDMPVIQTARIPLSQVFSNLLSNAIKYHDRPESAQITVSVKSLNDMTYEFTVTDNGPGIAPEYHDKVFQIFQTLNARDTIESTGVGLTVVKKIVEQLGGEIKLDSAEGEGSSFSFSIPKIKYEGQTANNDVDSENPTNVVERDQRSDKA